MTKIQRVALDQGNDTRAFTDQWAFSQINAMIELGWNHGVREIFDREGQVVVITWFSRDGESIDRIFHY